MKTFGLIVLLGFAASAVSQAQLGNTNATASGPLGSIFGSPLARGLSANDTVSVSNTYYFPHFAFGGGFQTTLTYVNYAPQPVQCISSFFADDGSPLQIPFGTPIPTSLGPGASFHIETQGAGSALGGWGEAQCNGLYRLYSGTTPLAEAGVNATTAPTTEFVTFAQSSTGIALANPSAQTATITINALDSTGLLVFSSTVTLAPNAHFAANLNDPTHLPGAPSSLNFTGSVQIVSPGVPILALSLNAEKFPAFSALPPGDISDGTSLATGH